MKTGKTPADPWNGATLEWSIPSPPQEYNFADVPHGARARRRCGRRPGPRAGDVSGAVHAGRVQAAAERHIPMPTPTIWPLIAAMGLGVDLHRA